jgi:hypothetical protein
MVAKVGWIRGISVGALALAMALLVGCDERDRGGGATDDDGADGTDDDGTDDDGTDDDGADDDGADDGSTDGGDEPPPATEWNQNAGTGAARCTLVWTGSEVISWGGAYTNGPVTAGGRYRPSDGRDIPLATENAPPALAGHSAVWTGSEMIIWGGYSEEVWLPLNQGWAYNPSTDTWRSISTENAPEPSASHSAAWTGQEMAVFGSYQNNDGGLYDPETDSWRRITSDGGPLSRVHGLAWTGSELLAFLYYPPPPEPYGLVVMRYSPESDTWSPPSAQEGLGGFWTAPRQHGVLWNGTEMFVVGPWRTDDENFMHGFRYDPISDLWTPIPSTSIVPAVWGFASVVADRKVIFWGGEIIEFNTGSPENFERFQVNDGAIYDLDAGSWSPTPGDAPQGRYNHSAIWSGEEVFISSGLKTTPYYGDVSSAGPTASFRP